MKTQNNKPTYIDEKILIKTFNLFYKCKIRFSNKIISFLITNYIGDSSFSNLLTSIYTNYFYKKNKFYKTFKITRQNIFNILGNKKIKIHTKLGQVNGLAYDATNCSGIIIPIEVSFEKGSGQLFISSNVRKLMKRSILVALLALKDHYYRFYYYKDDFWDKYDIHVNVALTLDFLNGASAGISFYTALISCMKKIHVKANIAMTGKLTRDGDVIPIGGVKGKLLAAIRNKNINTVILPRQNKIDVDDIPNFIKKKIKIIYVRNISEVIFHSLETNKYLIKRNNINCNIFN